MPINVLQKDIDPMKGIQTLYHVFNVPLAPYKRDIKVCKNQFSLNSILFDIQLTTAA